MERLVAKPQVGFMEAVKMGLGRLTDFKSRSRRSEFWWFMLAFIIVQYVVNFILALILPVLPAQIVSLLLWFIPFAVTVRRLHDTGRGGWWVVLSWVASAAYSIYFITSGLMDELQSVNADPTAALKMFTDPVMGGLNAIYLTTALILLIFCVLDGKPETNQYGESPKYKSLYQGFENQTAKSEETQPLQEKEENI